MSSAETSWLPLFPLEIVLLPGGRIPLHIFEPRYQAMAARCQKESLPFVIVLAQERKLAGVACEARIEEVLQTYPDGRSEILIQGGRRLVVRGLREHPDGYLEGEIESVPDAVEEPDPEASLTLWQLFQEYRKLEGDSEREEREEQEEGDEGENEEGTSSKLREGTTEPGYTYLLASKIEMTLPERQKLLETLSERDRERFLLAHLARLLPQIRIRKENQLRVRGNGRIASLQE